MRLHPSAALESFTICHASKAEHARDAAEEASSNGVLAPPVAVARAISPPR